MTIKVVVCVTGQHNELLDPVLVFEIEVDVNLDVMTDVSRYLNYQVDVLISCLM